MIVSCPQVDPRPWRPSVYWLAMQRAYRQAERTGARQESLSGLGQQQKTSTQAGRVVAGWSQVGQRIAQGGLTRENLLLSSGAITMATLETASLVGAKWATAAIPVVGPAVAGVTAALTFLFARKGPKQKRATTEIVEKIEPLLKRNLEGYFAEPVRTRAMQAQALANFDAGWQYLVEHCAIPEMGEPGRRCVEERKAGACHWRARCVRRIGEVCIEWGEEDPNGECWNWFVAYRDPIANDPEVQDDPEPVGFAGSIDDLLGARSGISAETLAAVALLVAGLFLLSSSARD